GMMPLGKVTDLTFRRTFMGRILNYGTMIVESAGQIQALNKVRYMPRPEEIYEALSELIFGEKGRTRASGMLAKSSWRRRF
ncbi:MAG: PH domain-containing protein, partial [Pseudonocardia sp.]